MPPEVSTHNEPDPAALDDVNDDTQQIVDDDASTDGTDPPQNDGTEGISADDLQLARDNGWTPEDEWKGDPEKWVDAKSFLGRSRGINALLQRENAALKSRLDRLEGRLDTSAETERTRQVAAIDSLIVDEEAKRVQAINDSDGAAVVETERTIDRLRGEKAKLAAPAKPAAVKPSPEDEAYTTTFYQNNQWIKEDRVARLAATMALQVRDEHPEFVGKVKLFLPELKRRMIAEYPELMNRSMRASRTNGDGTPPRGPAKTNRQTFESMPKDAQAACDRMIKQGLVKKREDYAKHYWENA